jgi:hypothetical protein
MAGFPLRTLLTAFGSRLRNARPIEHPELEVDAKRLNLSESVASASSLILPRASLVAELSITGAVRILHQEEAWNTDHKQAHPALTRTQTGRYSYSFASSYLDLDGNTIGTDLIMARVFVFEAGTATVSILGNTVNVFLKLGEQDTDMRFWLEVF